MTPILYHDNLATPGKQEFNVRIDSISETQYVLRACQIIAHGQAYSLPNDVSFDGSNMAIMVDLWAKPDGTINVLVYDRRIPRHMTRAGIQELKATYGVKVRPILAHVSVHHDLIAKKTYTGDYFLVNRQLKTGEAPADRLPVSPTRTVTPAITETSIPALQSALTVFKTSAAAVAPPKKWGELNQSEQQAVLAKMAAQMGLVAKD